MSTNEAAGGHNPFSTPPPQRRMTAESAEPLTWSQSPFSPQGLKNIARNKYAARLLTSTQKEKIARDFNAAKNFVARPRDSCMSLSGEGRLKDNELMIAIRFLLLLDGDEWVKMNADGKSPDKYYDLVTCLHNLHNR